MKYTRKRDAVFGRYPCCDLVNNAIRFILAGKTDAAVEELIQTIWKSDGYMHADIVNEAYKVHRRIWDERQKKEESK